MTDHDDHSDDPHIHVVPAGMAEALQHASEMHAMAVDAQTSRVYRLLDTLDPDGLLALRTILNQDQTSTSNQYWDGQIASILRVIHRVHPYTGEPDPLASIGDPATTDTPGEAL